MKPMICSSVNLLFLMSVILQVDGLRCHYVGTARRGQVSATLETFVRILRALNRVHYLQLLFFANKPRVESAYEEKIARARTRWQRADSKN
jgi:hypothetical protein